jgi:hypothetical protein
MQDEQIGRVSLLALSEAVTVAKAAPAPSPVAAGSAAAAGSDSAPAAAGPAAAAAVGPKKAGYKRGAPLERYTVHWEGEAVGEIVWNVKARYGANLHDAYQNKWFVAV